MNFFEISRLLGCGVLLLVIVRSILIYHVPKWLFCILWIVLASVSSALLLVAFPPFCIFGFSICIIVAYFVISNLRNRKMLRYSTQDHTPMICDWIATHRKKKYRVRISEQIIHPIVVGILHPIILFPANFNKKIKLIF